MERPVVVQRDQVLFFILPEHRFHAIREKAHDFVDHFRLVVQVEQKVIQPTVIAIPMHQMKIEVLHADQADRHQIPDGVGNKIEIALGTFFIVCHHRHGQFFPVGRFLDNRQHPICPSLPCPLPEGFHSPHGVGNRFFYFDFRGDRHIVADILMPD